ncbi:MAG: hypothetical protein JST53_03920 [Actinobacteria bacterium]|nr:hypothetical protein [Actinomycetota bacterium]
MITVVAMGMAAVPVIATVGSQEGSSRNQGSNEALAAAEAGAELAVLRQSKMLTENTAATVPSCVAPATLETSGASAGWCSAYPTAKETYGNAKFQYRVRPCYAGGITSTACNSVQLPESCKLSEGKDLVQVVSTGYATVGGREVTARVQVAACAVAVNPQLREAEKRFEEKLAQIEKTKTEPGAYEEKSTTEQKKVPPPEIWATGQIIGLEWVKMSGNSQVLNGGVGSNGAISASGSANVCGTVSLGGSGASFSTDNSSSLSPPAGCAVGRTVAKSTEKYVYPPVTLPSDIATNNSDWRICAETACKAGADPVGSGVWQRGNVSWNASNKQLTLTYNQLTLEGTAPYYLCQLVLAGGSSLYSSKSHAIRIYFAPPSACPGLNGAPQLVIANGTFVYGDSANGPLFLFVGSSTAGASKVELSGGGRSQQFVIYAPYTQINGNGGIVMTGSILGNTVELSGGAKLNEAGPFTPPPAGSFLPEEERPVPGTPEKTPGKVLKEQEAEKKTIEEEIERLKTGSPSSSEPLGRKSFVQCTAAPTTSTESADRGC